MTTSYDPPPDQPVPPKKKKLSDSMAEVGWLPGSIPQPSNPDLQLPPLPEPDTDNSMLSWVSVVDDHVRRKSAQFSEGVDFDNGDDPHALEEARQQALRAAAQRNSTDDVFGSVIPLAEGASGVNFADAMPPLAEGISGINLGGMPPLAEGVSSANLADASIPLAQGVSSVSLSDFFADLPDSGVPVAEGVSGTDFDAPLGILPAPLAEGVSGSRVPLGSYPVPLAESASATRLSAKVFDVPEAVPLSSDQEFSGPITSASVIDLPEATFLPDDEPGLPPEPTFMAEVAELPPEPLFTAEFDALPPEPTFTAEAADLPPEPLFMAESADALPDPDDDWAAQLPSAEDVALMAQPVSFAPSSLDMPVVTAWSDEQQLAPADPMPMPHFDSLLLPDENSAPPQSFSVSSEESIDDLLLSEDANEEPVRPGSIPDLFLDPEENRLGEDEVPLLSGEVRPPSVEMDAPFFPEDPGDLNPPSLADSFGGDESAWSPPRNRSPEDEMFGPASDEPIHDSGATRRGVPTQAMVDLDTLEGNLWAPDVPVEGDGALDMPGSMFAPPTDRTAPLTHKSDEAFDPMGRNRPAEDSDSALSQQLFGAADLDAADDNLFGPAHDDVPQRPTDTFDPLKPGSLAEIDMASLLNNPGAVRTQHDMGTDWHQPSGVVGEQSSAIDLNDLPGTSNSVPQSGMITASGSLPRPSADTYNPQEGSEVDLGSQPPPVRLQPDMEDDDDLEPLPKPPPRVSGPRPALSSPASGQRAALPTSAILPAAPAPSSSGRGLLVWLASGAIGLFLGVATLAVVLSLNLIPQLGAMLGLARVADPVVRTVTAPRNAPRDERILPTIPGREDKTKAGLQLLREGQLDDAINVLSHLDSTNPDVLLAQSQAIWLAYIRDQHLKGAKPDKDSEAWQKVNKNLTTLAQKNDPRALLWLGLVAEDLGQFNNAGQKYSLGINNFPEHKQMFETAQNRILKRKMTWQFLGEQPPLIPGEDTQSWHRPAPWGNLWTGLILLQMTDPPTTEMEEPGHAFYDALQKAFDNKYDEAVAALDKAIAAHRNRQLKQPKQGLNPVSDPREEIFIQAAYRIKLLWTLEKKLMASPGKSELTGRRRSPIDALDVVLKGGGMPADEGKLKDLVAKLTDAKIDAADPIKAVVDLISTNKDYVAKLDGLEKDKLALVKEKETLDEKLKVAGEDVKKAELKAKESDDKLKDMVTKLQEAEAKLKLGTAKDEALVAITKSLQDAKLLPADAKPEPAALAKLVGGAVSTAGDNEMKVELSKVKTDLSKAESALKASDDKLKGMEAKVTEAGTTALAEVVKVLQDAKVLPATAKPDAAAVAKAVGTLAAAGGNNNEMAAKLTGMQTDLTKTQAALKEAADKAKLAEDKANDEATKAAQAKVLAKDATDKLQVLQKLVADTKAQLEATQAALLKATSGKPTPVVKIDPTPVAPPPAPPSDLELAETHFNSGVSKFHSRSYVEAENELKKATELNRDDARYFYYLGLTKLSLGRSTEAADDFRRGATLERQSKPGTKTVSGSLERIQGTARQVLNSYRP